MRKRWLLSAGVVTLLALAAGAVWLHWPSDPITPANYRKIRWRMTEEQVSTVIGVPPGDYGTGYIGFPLRTGDDLVEESGVPFEDKDLWARRTPWKAWQKTGIVDKYWSGNNFYIWVTFDENQGAVGWYLFRFDRPGWPGLLDHLRSELGLQSAGGRPAVKRRVP